MKQASWIYLVKLKKYSVSHAKPVKPWSDEVRLKGEKDTLGLYLTGHPIDVYRNELKAFIPSKINELTPTRRGVTTVFAGLVVDVANFPNRMVVHFR